MEGGEKSQQKERTRVPELEYGRELFIRLFRDESPLINLGYTPAQRTAAKRALRSLEEEGRLFLKPYPWVSFGEEYVGAELAQLEHAGYYLTAFYDASGKVASGLFPKAKDRLAAQIILGERFGFFEDEPPGHAVIIHILSQEAAEADLATLVKHLYEGSGGTKRRVRLEEATKLATLKSQILPSAATYRAAWVDEETKLELVVENNFRSKALGEDASIKEVQLWRRLPTQDFKGKSWVPFGRKPNTSKKRLLKILEEKRERVVTGRLVLERV